MAMAVNAEKPVSVREAAKTAIVIAHREDTSQLLSFLASEGFSSGETRGPYPPESDSWSPIMKCMWNHMNAWRKIVASGRPGLVVEADFVPVRRFGSLPLPLESARVSTSLVYLYACGPEVYDLAGGLRGHAGGTVAYVASPIVANLMLQFGEHTLSTRDPREYWGWDTGLGFWLMQRGIESYLCVRQYGEHGGEPNPEHAASGLRGWHRADVLWDCLPWLPAYARGRRSRFYWLRAKSRLHGLARLLVGRYLRFHDIRRSSDRRRLLGLAMGRHWLSRGWCERRTHQLASSRIQSP